MNQIKQKIINFIKSVYCILNRDIKLQMRNLSDITSIIFFFIIIILIFIFSIGPDEKQLSIIGASILWSVLILSTSISINKSLVDDYRELDLDFKFIISMAGWCIVLHHAKDRDGEDMINFKNIDNHHRNKLFLSRNNKGKIHRTEWVKFLEDNNLKEKGYVSEGWNGIFLEHLNGDFIETVENFAQIGYNYWNQRYPSRDDFSLMNFYNDSFCEVVLSSEDDIKASPYGAFDSEKEWRQFL